MSAEDIQRRKEDRAEKQKANSAWSNQTRRKEERDKRRDKKDLKKRWQKAQAAAGVEAVGTKRGAADADDGSGDDWDDLAREERMAKRVKKGHMSQSEFDAQFVDL